MQMNRRRDQRTYVCSAAACARLVCFLGSLDFFQKGQEHACCVPNPEIYLHGSNRS